MNNNPIAVIDSGVGGLACLGAIRKAMPHEDIIYFGDTMHMPYGTKSKEELNSYAEGMAKYFTEKGVKMIILACGTLSAVAMNTFYRSAPMMLVQGVIEPVVAATSRASQDGDAVGVIATPRSIESGSYQTAFERLTKKLDVSFLGCPELASAIESGKTQGEELEALLHSYLDEMVNEKKIKTLLLGCTHYPLVSDTILKLYPELKLVNPAESLAKNASTMLKVHGLAADSAKEGSLKITASKITEGFSSMAKLVGLGDMKIEEVSY